LRRATDGVAFGRVGSFVSIHARLATGDANLGEQAVLNKVSIHARLATGDVNSKGVSDYLTFQFTPVLRRATLRNRRNAERLRVSIHARLATGDPIDLEHYQ